MKTKILLCIILLTGMLSCKKETGSAAAPKGIISLINNSGNDYDVIINGALVINNMPGNSWKDLSKPAGTYSIRVVQVNGYLLYPTELTFDGVVEKNKKLLISFPD